MIRETGPGRKPAKSHAFPCFTWNKDKGCPRVRFHVEQAPQLWSGHGPVDSRTASFGPGNTSSVGDRPAKTDSR